MIVLYIVGALFALILLLLFINVNFIFCIKSEPSVKIRVLFVTFDALRLAEKYADSHKEAQPLDEKEESEPSKKAKMTPSRIIYLIKYITRLVKAVTAEFCRYVRVRVCHVWVRVATDDAADTARLYGTVSGAVWSLLEFLSHNMRVRRCDKNVKVFPDFTSTESELDIKLVLRIKPIHALSALIHLMPILMKRKVGTKNE